MKRLLSVILSVILLLPASLLSAFADKSENVALGKMVVTSSGTGEDFAVDGNTATYWDSTVGRNTPHSTLTVDLMGWYRLDEVTVITYYDGARYYKFTVEISTDGIDYILIGDKDDTVPATASGVTFEAADMPVRYIKVTMTENSANPEYHICELMAFGTKDEDYKEEVLTEDKDDPDNIAFGKPTRANGNDIFSERVTDGKIKTAWTGTSFPQFVDVDLMDNYDISEISVYMPTSCEYTYTVYGSLDGVNFDRLAESNERKAGTEQGDTYTFDELINYRIIRVNVTSSVSGAKASVCEIKVHGIKNSTEVIPTREKLEFTSYDEWLLENHGVDINAIKDANGKYDIEDTYTEQDTIDALNGLVTRILGSEYVDWFEFAIAENPISDNDYYEICNSGSGKISIIGNDGVAIASGLNYYLKYYCKVNVSQQTKQVKMPESIILIEGDTLRKETECEVRYAYNFCTLSYTMQFYGFDEWQRELDYLMLNGVNVILDTTASEALWVMYLQQYGYTADEAIDFVCGYAYKAWWLMGNLENFGGNVGDRWIYDTLEMARVNQRYMTVMGCMPCLNIFAGTLPADFSEKAGETLAEMGYPDIGDHMTGTGYWAGFVRPHSLNSTFSGFKKMSDDFYSVQNHLYGRITDYYAGDFLHEIEAGFQLDASFNKAELSRTVLDYLIEENDDACWIMQSWWENPLPEVVEGFGDNREDHVLMLDLAAASGPRWTNTDSFGGLEFGGCGWVFCMLDNYGGRTGMNGAFENVMNGLFDAYEGASHFKGIGITPEGTEENPASYDFYWELIWVSPDDIPDGQSRKEFVEKYVEEWISEYALRRYGSDSENIQEAWKLLGETVYGKKNVNGTAFDSIYGQYPALVGSDGRALYYSGITPYYDTEKLEQALELMMLEFDNLKDEETYIYDLCDIMVQVMTNNSASFYTNMVYGLINGDFEKFRSYKNKFVRCMELIDEISSYVDDTTLANWVGRVDNWVNDEHTGEYSDYDIDTMKHNSLILITTWASHESLVGYANRAYSGLVNDYYCKMWSGYLDETESLISDGEYTIPEADRALYFKYAWDLIVSRGEKYTQSNTDTDTVRGLKEIYTEISDRQLKSATRFINNIVIADSGSGLAIEDKKLNGVTDTMTAGYLSAALKGDTEGTIGILDENGNQLAEDAKLTAGCKVILLDKYGAKSDFLNIESIEKTEATGEESTEENTSEDENSQVGVWTVVIIAIAAVILAGTAVVLKKKKSK